MHRYDHLIRLIDRLPALCGYTPIFTLLHQPIWTYLFLPLVMHPYIFLKCFQMPDQHEHGESIYTEVLWEN